MSEQIVFVVGSSRSGTTMMGRVLNKSNKIHTLNEIHFFEQLWTPGDKDFFDLNSLRVLAAKLISIERDGYLNDLVPEKYLKEADVILDKINATSKNEIPYAVAVYKSFLEYEGGINNCNIICEQTPRNLLYLNEIFKYFKNPKIIYMLRDPRDVLLSQKNRWRRKLLGSTGSRTIDMVRDWSNYHPITISLLWRGAEKVAKQFRDNEHVMCVQYENFVTEPEKILKKICSFLDVRYDENMLKVPSIGSSSQPDNSSKIGLDPSRIGSWRKKGISNTEIYLCEKVLKSEMSQRGFNPSGLRPNILMLLYYYLSLPLQLVISLLLNFKRMTKLREAVFRRFFNKGY